MRSPRARWRPSVTWLIADTLGSDGTAEALLTLVAGGLAGTLVYVAGLALLRVEELRAVTGLARTRLRG